MWIVSFMGYDLGFIDLEARTLQPPDTPFAFSVTYDSGLDITRHGRGGWIRTSDPALNAVLARDR